MPTQHTIFGYPVRLRMPPRRFQLLLAFILFIIVTLGLYGPPSSTDLPTYQEVKEAVKNPHVPTFEDLPSIPQPFGPSAHKPPVQPDSNSTSSSSYRVIEWLSDFKWRNPFSDSTTLEENRAVLPPLLDRPPIYTFYDAPGKQEKTLSEAENRLILAWRRAWWAQGFRPQVLSRGEAMKHPQYQLVQRMKLDSVVEQEIMRWLAWGRMGGGILSDYFAFPMAEHDNPMLSFLRRKEYPSLSRIDTLQNAVFYGEGAAVNEAIKKAVNSKPFKNVTANKDKITDLGKKQGGAMVNLLTRADIQVDSNANSIAYYSKQVIDSKYKTVADKLINTTKVEGLDLLTSLVNSHLHLTFQETFSSGVIVVKPLPAHTTALMDEAIDIARNLTQCPTSPIPKSCPPNRLKCKTCDGAKQNPPQLATAYKNVSTYYNVGTVPHPYTFNSLHYARDTLDVNFLRREAKRDQWIHSVSQDVLDLEHSSEESLVLFKDNVAAQSRPSNSLWLTAERESQADLDWIFGFNLPQLASDNEAPSSPSDASELIIFPRPTMPKPLEGVQVPNSEVLEGEKERLKKARGAIKSKERHMQEIVQAVEQWNPADYEAWKFSRAFSARRRMERVKWEEEEKKYAGAENKAGIHSGGGRWIDKFKL